MTLIILASLLAKHPTVTKALQVLVNAVTGQVAHSTACDFKRKRYRSSWERFGKELFDSPYCISRTESTGRVFDHAHNPKVVSSNLTPATIRAGKTKGPPEMLPGGRCSILVQIVREMSVFSLAKNEMTMELIRLRRVPN